MNAIEPASIIRDSAHVNSSPFKGESVSEGAARWGMGKFAGNQPYPHPNPPLEGEGTVIYQFTNEPRQLPKALKRRQAGFSFVDVMVGMVISLIGIIIIFQVFDVSEGIKRRTSGGGEAQQNGAAALFQLERSIKQGGYGFNSNDAAAAVAITSNAATVPDSIAVSYRRNWDYGSFLPQSGVTFIPAPPAITTETFTINGAQLVTDNGVPGTTVVIADGIVQLKAAGIVDSVQGLVALRVALVTRSSQPEKPNPATGNCDTTVAAPVWSQGTLDISGNLGLGAGDDWRCYRYKTFETTVPLRNVIWR